MPPALITAPLAADPQERTARNGNSFALARLSVPVSEAGRIHCSLLAFEESAVKRLLDLREGASVSAAGTLKVATRTLGHGDDPWPILDLQADEIAATTPRLKKPRAEQSPDQDPHVPWLEA